MEERFEAPQRTDAEVARRDEARTVRSAMGTLPADQCQVIELAYFGGFTHTEIAEMLDTPVGTVKAVSTRTRSRGDWGFGSVPTHLGPKHSAMSRN